MYIFSRKNLLKIFILTCFIALPFSKVFAAEIYDDYRYAVILEDSSRINMKTDYGVNVYNSSVTGYAWSENYGWINFDPSGDEGVENNNGTLLGYAWGENLGWINFAPTNGGVTIDSDGYWHGYAWSEKVGWIAFNCSESTLCDTYKVRSQWTSNGASGGGGGSSGGGSSTTTEEPPVIPPTVENPPVDSGDTTPINNNDNPGNDGDISSPDIDTPVPPIPPIEEPDIPLPTEDNVPDNFNPFSDAVLSSISILEDIIISTLSLAENIVSSPEGDTTVKIVTTLGIIFAGISSMISVMFANPLSISEIVLIPVRLWSLLLTALGIRKKNKPWGVVYDAVTKQPLDPVYVTLFDEMNSEVGSTITDIDGRYGFFVSRGRYRVVPGKTHYSFPSSLMAGKDKDELYNDIYHGEIFEITSDESIITKNIPMDPVGFDWNEYAKSQKNLNLFYSRMDKFLAVFSDVLFVLGFAISIIATTVSPVLYNIIIMSLYVVMLFLKETVLRPKPQGRIIFGGEPLAFAIVKVYDANTGMMIGKKPTNKNGAFYLLVGKGTYYLTIDKKLDDGTYQEVHKTTSFEAKTGYIDQKISF